MAKKAGVTISLETPAALRGVKLTNSAGANKATLGSDTVPGDGVGAPLYNSRSVDDFATKTERFHGEHGDTIGGLNGRRNQPGMERTLKGNAPRGLSASATPASRQMPDKNIISKKVDACGALGGDVPRGVLGK